MDLILIYLIGLVTCVNSIMFFGSIRKYHQNRQLIKAYLEDLRKRGGRITNIITFPRETERRIRNFQIQLKKKVDKSGDKK